MLHHLREVGAEHLLPNRLRERADRVHRDPTELGLLALSGEGQEGREVVHRRLEVRHEALLGGVGGAADGAGDDRLDGDGGGLEEAGEALHDELQVELDGLVEDLQQGIERSARGALGGRVVDEVHDALKLG